MAEVLAFDFNKILDKTPSIENKYGILFMDIINKPISTVEEILVYIDAYISLSSISTIADINRLSDRIKKAGHFVNSKLLEEDFI